MSKKVLLVEDHPLLRTLLESVIASWGYKVVSARNGWRAYEILADDKDDTFSAVVTDMYMPGGSGLIFCQAANRLAQCPPTLVHSTEMRFEEGEAVLEDLGMLMSYFKFVKEVHQKSPTHEFDYVKRFLKRHAV